MTNQFVVLLSLASTHFLRCGRYLILRVWPLGTWDVVTLKKFGHFGQDVLVKEKLSLNFVKLMVMGVRISLSPRFFLNKVKMKSFGSFCVELVQDSSSSNNDVGPTSFGFSSFSVSDDMMK